MQYMGCLLALLHFWELVAYPAVADGGSAKPHIVDF
jgi:hypothetical protein